jgi:hypothetical protein
MYDPGIELGDDDDYEWIELYNYGEHAVLLDGWTVNGVKLAGKIPPNEFFIIARQDISDPDQDGEFFTKYYNKTNGYKYWATVFDAKGKDLKLENNEGTVVLIDSQGVVADKFHYTCEYGGAGNGASLERRVCFHPSSKQNIKENFPPELFGNPGVQNSSAPIEAKLSVGDTLVFKGDSLLVRLAAINKTPSYIQGELWGELRKYEVTNYKYEFKRIPFIIKPFSMLENISKYYIPGSTPLGKYIIKTVIGEKTWSLVPENAEFTVSSTDRDRERFRKSQKNTER